MITLRDNERWARVAVVDDAQNYVAVITDGALWNGFECPSFLRDQIERMRADFDALAALNDGGEVDTLRWAGDDPNVLELVSGSYNVAGDCLDPGDEPAVDRINPDERGLYGVGGWQWCWDQVADLSEGEVSQ